MFNGDFETFDSQEMKHSHCKRSASGSRPAFAVQGLRGGSELLLMQILICRSGALLSALVQGPERLYATSDNAGR